MPSTDITGLLTVPAVADYLAVHDQTVRKLIRRGDLLATRIGTRVLIDPRDLADFIERHRGP